MFDAAQVLAFIWVILVWSALAMAIRHWGLGLARRRVRCPETHARAEVRVVQVEPSFGAIRTGDVTACSLFGGGPVSCDKPCLARL